MVVTKEDVLESLEGENVLQQFVTEIMVENKVDTYKQVLEVLVDLFNTNGKAKQKYFSAKLLMNFSEKGNFINALVNNKQLLEKLKEFALVDKDKPYKERGVQLFGDDPVFSSHFYNLIMECLSFWGAKYSVDSKGNPTKFVKILEYLNSNGVEPKMKLEQMQLNEEQYARLKNYAIEQQFKQNRQMAEISLDDLKKMYQNIYSETTAMADEMEQNLKGEEEPTEIMDMLLETSIKQAEELKPKLDLLVQRQDEFGEGMRKQINLRAKFINTFIEKHKIMRNEGFTSDSYLQFRYDFRMVSRELTGSPMPKPPANAKPTSQPPPEIKPISVPKHTPEPAKPPPQQPPKQQQNIQKPQEYQQYPQTQKQPEYQYPQYNERSKHQQPPHQTQQNYQSPQPYQQVNKPNINQKPQLKETQQIKPPAYRPPPPPQFQKTIPKQPTYHQPEQQQQFEDNYDNRSQSSQHSCKDFPLRGNLNLITKPYDGQFVPYDDRNFEIFNEIYTNNGINRIKRANLKNRYSIFESSDIQIGFDSNLIYHEITNRYFLRLRLCFGNKTDDILQNFQYNFEGDSSMGIWSQEPFHQHSTLTIKDQMGRIYLGPKQQMYLPITINYNRIPYEVISGSFSYETTETQERKISHFIIPCLLTKFMSFRDTSVESFKTRWLYKDKYILKSEQIPLNPKIIKSPDDFLKNFGPNNVLLLTDYNSYLNQTEREMVDIEFGLTFTFGSPQIEFLLKIIVFPNHTVLFQIIPYQSYVTQAEAFLHTLVFLFCMPD